MVRSNNYPKQLHDLYEAAARPYRELQQLQRTYEVALQPFRQLEELYSQSNIAREAFKYRDWQEQFLRQVRPAVTDLNISSHIAAAMRTPTALGLVEEQRRLISDFAIPHSFQTVIDAI